MKTAASIVAVRRAGPDDAATVLTMVRETAAHEGDAGDVTGTRDTWAAMLARPEVVVLVAERDGVPAGYVSAVRRLRLRLRATLRTKVVAAWSPEEQRAFRSSPRGAGNGR